MSILGEPLTRVDGRLKVTGQAKYAAEFKVPDPAYAAMVQSTIPSGRMANIDARRAERAAGVIAVLTPRNAPKLPGAEKRVSVLQNFDVHYNRQPIAVVVAENLHSAQHAASLIEVQYEPASPKLDSQAGFPNSYPGSHNDEPGDMSWGDVDAGLAQAEVKIDQVYTTPIEHHNPMEPHATIARWEGDHLTLHDASQNVFGVKKYLAKTRVMYACSNISTRHRLVPLNLGTPAYMRAPGVATGTYALEVAMDELAYELKMDPLQLRLLNYTDVDPHSKKPFTEKSLRECYARGAERFGWSKRNHAPRSMQKGSLLMGWGMATETYPTNSKNAGAVVRLLPNGKVYVASGTEDIGTGMYTIMTQVTADALGISPDLVEAKIGDTGLPEAPGGRIDEHRQRDARRAGRCRRGPDETDRDGRG